MILNSVDYGNIIDIYKLTSGSLTQISNDIYCATIDFTASNIAANSRWSTAIISRVNWGGGLFRPISYLGVVNTSNLYQLSFPGMTYSNDILVYSTYPVVQSDMLYISFNNHTVNNLLSINGRVAVVFKRNVTP